MKPKLVHYAHGDTDLFYSPKILEELDEDDESISRNQKLDYLIETTLNDFVNENPKYREICDIHAEKNGLRGQAILDAHGNIENGKWVYSDGEKDFSVQGWINSKDGKYAVLIVRSCNPDGYGISSKKSVVLAPNAIYSPARRDLGDGQVEIYVPGKGYIDSYEIDLVLEQMRNPLPKRKKIRE